MHGHKITRNEMDVIIGSYWHIFVAFIIVFYSIYSYITSNSQQEKYKKLIEEKKSRFQTKIEKMRRHLSANNTLITEERKLILSYPILELVRKLRDGDLDPVSVLEAYQAQALIATEKTNCVVDFCEESLDIAKKLRSVPEEKRGPLYGLPVSIKECFYVKGYDHTNGLAKEIGKPSENDGSFIKILREKGAVPFCITNIPQTMLSYACSNPVYGCTTNPFDNERTPGGSSGGEACLLALGGSILGLGSDVGGSLRIPAHFCGITALKPTFGRLPERGRDMGWAAGVASNAGFMCKSVDGVTLGMKTLLQNPNQLQELDHSVVPIPWRNELYNPKRKLKIGWYDSDGFMEAVPGCKRAVAEAIKILSTKGHELVPFQPPDLDVVQEDFFRFMLADLGRNNLVRWKGEILDQSIEINNLVYKIPFWIRKSVAKFVFRFVSPSMYRLADCAYHFAGDLWTGIKKAEQRKEKILNAWKEAGIDVLICPGFLFPAPPLNHPARLVPAVNFTAVYNVLNLPVGSVPITKYNKDDEAAMENYPTNDVLYNIIKNGTKGAIGLPLNVQVIGKPWHEELVLSVMKEFENAGTNEGSVAGDSIL